ncbi:probable pectinesterase/pectinesterase inhibitor 39 [Papaver somniferum]|uniref:probable pectinesterase/pectinesterase inhibitor 39 n=1 Tax=Papaver somniferum TaxID=3469 RepID=UPI000E6FB56D|nr:probable pectinesterase/pectinesterase inhibitor 39 [Papaver somniferum]
MAVLLLFFFSLFTILSAQPSIVDRNVTVSYDGSGNFTTIGEAIESAPSLSTSIYVIYITKGENRENVVIPQHKKNLVFVGDGMLNTKIIGDRSNATGFGTQDTATVVVLGDGFIVQDIAIINAAGPDGNQVVALGTEADRCVFYKCRIEAYQDSLYAKKYNQFYRECDILGTVDFIFGQSSTILQNCNIYCRKPNLGQSITIVADGRDTLNRNTGIVLHNCSVLATPELEALKQDFFSYFGRPWRNYSCLNLKSRLLLLLVKLFKYGNLYCFGFEVFWNVGSMADLL